MAKAAERPDNHDRLDQASKLAVQLEAMLRATIGHAGEGFRRLTDVYQSNFLWACADVAEQLADVLNEIEVRHG